LFLSQQAGLATNESGRRDEGSGKKVSLIYNASPGILKRGTISRDFDLEQSQIKDKYLPCSISEVFLRRCDSSQLPPTSDELFPTMPVA